MARPRGALLVRCSSQIACCEASVSLQQGRIATLPVQAHWLPRVFDFPVLTYLVVKQVWSLGLSAPFAHNGTLSLTSTAVIAMLLANIMRLAGLACLLQLWHLQKGPSCACIIPALHTLILCQSRSFSCPYVTNIWATCSVFGWVHTIF